MYVTYSKEPLMSNTRKMHLEIILIFELEVVRPKRRIGSKKIFFFLKSNFFRIFFALCTELYPD
jgi:hypothetical protein